ncbi:hypothetical protein D3C71_2228560 [compost metagenome]
MVIDIAKINPFLTVALDMLRIHDPVHQIAHRHNRPPHLEQPSAHIKHLAHQILHRLTAAIALQIRKLVL